MSIIRYSFVHWAALLTAVRNSPCSCPFSVSLTRPQDALNCAMSPANLAGQDRPGKIENNRMAKKKNKAPKGYTFHKTKAGDTMYMISQIYGIKLAKLLQYNYMGNDEKPQVGEMISLRGPAQLY